MVAPNKDLGPCVVIWDADGTPVSFEMTFGGVFFRYEELRAPIKRDQAGLTDVDEVTTGAVNPELECPFTQELVTKLVNMFAFSSAAADYLKVKNPVGAAVFALSKQVIVKPITNGVVSITDTEWLYIHRGFPRVTMEQVYDNSGQRCVKVLIKGFPDDYSTRVDEMWRYGPAA